METNKLSKTLTIALNAQIAKEAYASQIFLSYASWAEKHGYCGIANFLFRHSQEERNNMMTIIDYILKRGAEVKITSIPAPPENPENINTCLEEVYQIEGIYTKGIHDIVKMSSDEKDWTTYKFIQMFVKEHVEEETFARSLLNKMEKSDIQKESDDSVYMFEKETVSTNDNALSETNIRLQNPNINRQQQ
jgi:ferritin